MIVYKIFLEKEFLTLKKQKISYGSAVDKKDGFIHLSTKNKLKETLEIYFSNSKSVYILGFECARLDRIVWETSRNNELFPHLYGKIHFENIDRKIFLEKNQGHFLIPIDFLN